VDPDYYEARFNLGCSYEKLRDMPRAVEAYEAAMAINPEAPPAYHNLARMYYIAGRYEEAVEKLERLDELRPDNPPTLYNLYRCHKALGNTDEAEAYYKRATTIDPRYTEIPLESREFIPMEELERQGYLLSPAEE